MIGRRLLKTGELVAALNHSISRQTISHYVREGLLTPTETTPGGHHRWDVDDVRAQLKELRKRDP